MRGSRRTSAQRVVVLRPLLGGGVSRETVGHDWIGERQGAARRVGAGGHMPNDRECPRLPDGQDARSARSCRVTATYCSAAGW